MAAETLAREARPGHGAHDLLHRGAGAGRVLLPDRRPTPAAARTRRVSGMRVEPVPAVEQGGSRHWVVDGPEASPVPTDSAMDLAGGNGGRTELRNVTTGNPSAVPPPVCRGLTNL